MTMPRPHSFTVAQVDRMEFLREECNWSPARIGAEFGVDAVVIRGQLAARGVPDQPRHYRVPAGGGFNFAGDNIQERRRA